MKRLILAVLALAFLVVLPACSEEPEYSYEYLKSVQNEISSYFQSFDDEGYANDKLCQMIVGVVIVDDYVRVCLTEPTEENIALFRERVSDSEAIRFVQGEKGHGDSG